MPHYAPFSREAPRESATARSLILGAIVAVALQLFTAYVPAPPSGGQATAYAVTTAAVGLSFFVAGIMAWAHWPTNRLGLLFTLVGYFWLLPAITLNVRNSLTFTIGYLSQPFYQAPLTQLALSWPTGRLRSGFERESW